MSLVEKYVEALEALSGTPFQDAVCTRLRCAIPSFQKIPDESGDGGLDGFSHNGETGYCCYGLELDAAKTEDDFVSMTVDKFQKDLRRLFELEEPPKKVADVQLPTDTAPDQVADSQKSPKARLQHAPNKELESVLGKDTQIKHIRLVVNRFKSKKVLGRLQTALKRYKSTSQCRFVDPGATLVLDGPKELAEEHIVDELTLSLAKQQKLYERLSESASSVNLPKSRTFDSKMTLLKQIRPGNESAIDAMADDFKTDWKFALASEKDLSDAAPNLHRALERSKRRLLTKVNKLMVESDEPWNQLTTASELAEEMLGPALESWFGELLGEVCNGEVAALIGDCPIGWENSNAADA
jgi:hypothetical protein